MRVEGLAKNKSFVENIDEIYLSGSNLFVQNQVFRFTVNLVVTDVELTCLCELILRGL